MRARRVVKEELEMGWEGGSEGKEGVEGGQEMRERSVVIKEQEMEWEGGSEGKEGSEGRAGRWDGSEGVR